jgi:hypothetical protein
MPAPFHSKAAADKKGKLVGYYQCAYYNRVKYVDYYLLSKMAGGQWDFDGEEINVENMDSFSVFNLRKIIVAVLFMEKLIRYIVSDCSWERTEALYQPLHSRNAENNGTTKDVVNWL